MHAHITNDTNLVKKIKMKIVCRHAVIRLINALTTKIKSNISSIRL